MVVEVYLDGTLLKNEPIGVREITELIERDTNLHGYVVKYNEITLTFIGDGYVFVRDKIKSYTYESRIELKIVIIDSSGYTDTINAFFFTTDIKFNATELTYEVKLEDNNFGAYLKAGYKEKVSPTATITKNGETLSNPMSNTQITLYTPSTGVNLVTDARVYALSDLMVVLTQYLSDNKMTATFSNLDIFGASNTEFGLTKHYFIGTGRGSVPDNKVSYEEMMEFLYKTFNVMFWVDISDENTYYIIFGHENDLMEDYLSVTFSQVRDLLMSFDQNKFYSVINLGTSEDNKNDQGFYTLPYTPLVGFSEESVNVRSKTTLDNELNLSSSNYIYGTNKIEELLTSTSYSEKNLFIQYGVALGRADKGTYGITGASRLYNEQLLNINVLARHNVQSTFVNEIGTDTDGFKAYITTNTAIASTVNPVIFNDDSVNGFDTGTNYGTGTGQYTIPAGGLFRFKANIFMQTTSLMSQQYNTQNGVSIDVSIRRNGTIIETGNFVRFGVHQTPIQLDVYAEAYFDAGDLVTVSWTSSFLITTGTGTNASNILGTFTYTDENGNSVIGGSNFSTVFVYNSGGAVTNPDTLDYPAVNYDFEYNISLADWKVLRGRPIQGVKVNTNGNNNSLAWIKKISRNWITGESNVTLFTKLSENNI